MRSCIGLAFLAAYTAAVEIPGSTPQARSSTPGSHRKKSKITWPYLFPVTNAYLPSTAGGGNQSYSYYHGDDNWVAPYPDDTTIELQDLTDAIGFRVLNAPNSAVWVVGTGKGSGPLSYYSSTYWVGGQPDLGVDVYSYLFTTYPHVVNATGGPDASYGPAAPLPFSMGFSFSNADCNDFDLTAVLAYVNGSTRTVAGQTNSNLAFDSSADLINFTLVVAQYPDMNNTFYWNQSAASLFSVAYAPGPGLPTVAARHQAEIQFCPD